MLIEALAAIALQLAAASAQPSAGACPIAGNYWVAGRIPGAVNAYRGKAVISRKGGGCHMKWYPPNDSQGSGTYSDGVLTIYFTFAKGGGSGVVRYSRGANGNLQGVWWMNNGPSAQGMEVLSLAGPPQLAVVSIPVPVQSSPATPSADWTYLNIDRGITAYYKYIGASPEGYRRVQVRLEYGTSQQASGLSFTSSVSTIDADCAGRRFRIAEDTVFEKANLGGNSFRIPPKPYWDGTQWDQQRWTATVCGN